MSKYPKLDEYIKKARAEGKTDDQLRGEMKGAGYNEEDVNDILHVEPALNRSSISASPVKEPINKKDFTKIGRIFAYSILLVSLFGGSFYFWNTGAFASAPYNQNNLFSGLSQKISQMETFSYSFKGFFMGEKRDPDAEIFEPLGNSLELKEKYYRDYQRIQFYNDFRRKFRSSPPNNLDSVSDLIVNDPLTNQVYEYKLINGGNDFEISINFETLDAIKAAEEGNEISIKYGYSMDPLKIEGKKVTFKKDSRSLGLRSKPPQNFYESLNDSLDSIPKEIDVGAVIDFRSSVNDEVIDFAVDLDAEGDLGDITYKISANTIKKDENFYLRVNNFPSIFLMFMPLPKEEWIIVEEDSFLRSIIPTNDFIEKEESKDEVKKFYQKVLALADKNKLLSIIDSPKKEKVNGNAAYRYNLELNNSGLEPFIEGLISELNNGEYDFADNYLVELENFREYIKSEEFVNVLNYYNKNTKNTLWVNKKGYIVKFESSNRFVPSSDNLSDTQFKLILSVELDNINEKININAPDNFKTLEEVEDSFTSPISSARDKGSDAAIKANLSSIRAMAELVYSADGGYGLQSFDLGPCKNRDGTLFGEKGIYGYIQSATVDGQMKEATCVSKMTNGSVQSWAVSVPLVTDPDYSFCVDSSGSAMEIIGSISGDTCDGSISKKKDNTVETEPITVKKTTETKPVTEVKTEAELIRERARDTLLYDTQENIAKCFGISSWEEEKRKVCFENVESELYESQKKFSIDTYGMCGEEYEIQKRSFSDPLNNVNINDLAKLYTELADKEEIGLFCEEFKGFFKGHKVGIAVENFLTEPGGFDYKKIRFYKLFDKDILNNQNSGFTTQIDYREDSIEYLPELNPGDFRKDNPGGGYTTSWVSLGGFR